MIGDEKRTNRVGLSPASPKGLAFDIADLLRAQDWARLRLRPMRIQLDHAVDGEEYEEVIELHSGSSARSKLLIWRSERSVYVQPLPGRKQRFASMEAALRSLCSDQDVVVTDITATAWPTD